ncbi:unnamed protein product [Trichogramma brassicae]|uniref:Uncharacterized protein n=1 Tax=Trichogramma brassicae TaxID=86971 RepID=A0A6H5I7V8_9HYME|nr:unnamed protein product [Trichogramma brassicae]
MFACCAAATAPPPAYILLRIYEECAKIESSSSLATGRKSRKVPRHLTRRLYLRLGACRNTSVWKPLICIRFTHASLPCSRPPMYTAYTARRPANMCKQAFERAASFQAGRGLARRFLLEPILYVLAAREERATREFARNSVDTVPTLAAV